MSFIVQCPFCNLRARVPAKAEGASGLCPKCSSHFTLVPADDQNAPESAAPRKAASTTAEPAPPLRASVQVAIAVASVATERPKLLMPEAGAATAAGSRVANVAGTLALLLGGAALLCAAATPLCGLVRPLAALGLATGVIGWLLGRRSWRLMPAAGTLMTGGVLGVALLAPSLLGPTYERTRYQRTGPPVLRAIPLKGAPALAEVPEWVDGRRYALHYGNLEVQVVSVSIGPLPGRAADKKAKPVDYLLVRLRARRNLVEKAGSAPADAQHRPKLSDAAGTVYALKDSTMILPVRNTRKSSPFPVVIHDEVFAFERPPAGTEGLRIEAPGALWSGSGVFRFTLPAPVAASMALPVPLK